ncbi:unnamed protein product [Prorocentrum cordatum]|uniref:Uncharacterized protein n=1 Tax=Prorocentrum cordatum TaxID=2364126 RepID=A0ABN9PYB7_9DINO|nr:unnamed protein product [Polarella glacialis]
MDIECCPQRDKKKMARACRSIPNYVQRSSFFIVLVPQSLHDRGVVVDIRTWERRAWCRGERAFNALSENPKLCIVAESTTSVYVQMSRDWLWRQPCTGDLTVESDRDAIGNALLSALDLCAEHARQKGDMLRCRMTLAIKSEQLRGSDSGAFAEPAFDDWMEQMGFTSHEDGREGHRVDTTAVRHVRGFPQRCQGARAEGRRRGIPAFGGEQHVVLHAYEGLYHPARPELHARRPRGHGVSHRAESGPH